MTPNASDRGHARRGNGLAMAPAGPLRPPACRQAACDRIRAATISSRAVRAARAWVFAPLTAARAAATPPANPAARRAPARATRRPLHQRQAHSPGPGTARRLGVPPSRPRHGLQAQLRPTPRPAGAPHKGRDTPAGAAQREPRPPPRQHGCGAGTPCASVPQPSPPRSRSTERADTDRTAGPTPLRAAAAPLPCTQGRRRGARAAAGSPPRRPDARGAGVRCRCLRDRVQRCTRGRSSRAGAARLNRTSPSTACSRVRRRARLVAQDRKCSPESARRAVRTTVAPQRRRAALEMARADR